MTGTMTDATKYPANAAILPPRSKVTVSFIMVEKVENPPRKPVASS